MSRRIPKWMWCESLKCVVEVEMAGHFPDTLMVKTPTGLSTEVYLSDLKSFKDIHEQEAQAKNL